MSDCFNHALDAFESLGQDPQPSYTYSKGSHFEYDPLFYHRKHEVQLVHETKLAYRFKDSKGEFWIAKSLCKKFKPKKGTVFIWRKAALVYE